MGGELRGKKIARHSEREKNKETKVTQEVMSLLGEGCMTSQGSLARKRKG